MSLALVVFPPKLSLHCLYGPGSAWTFLRSHRSNGRPPFGFHSIFFIFFPSFIACLPYFYGPNIDRAVYVIPPPPHSYRQTHLKMLPRGGRTPRKKDCVCTVRREVVVVVVGLAEGRHDVVMMPFQSGTGSRGERGEHVWDVTAHTHTLLLITRIEPSSSISLNRLIATFPPYAFQCTGWRKRNATPPPGVRHVSRIFELVVFNGLNYVINL